MIRYLPGLAKPLYQGQLNGTTERKAFADDKYKDLKVAEFAIQLSNNEYMNFHGVHIVFPMKIKKIKCCKWHCKYRNNRQQLFCTLDKRNWY